MFSYKKWKLPKPRKGAWFVPLRGSYLPCSWQGWLTYVPYIAYLGVAVYAVCQENVSSLNRILRLSLYWIAAVIVMHWVAKQKS